jgi:PhnB protein
MTKSHIYPGGQTVNCYLTIKNCGEALEFYKKAFGAVEKLRLVMPDGTVAHAEILIEGTLLMMAEENPDWGTQGPLRLGGSPVTLSIYVEDADASFKRAIDAGAKVVMPLKDEFYGDRIGQVVDPYGYKWGIATHLEDVSQEEMQSRMDKLFSQG